MPTAIDRLEKNSSKAQEDAAISDCIATEIKHGKDRDQAVAMCHSMAREKMGKEM